jgi:hypothetical protein
MLWQLLDHIGKIVGIAGLWVLILPRIVGMKLLLEVVFSGSELDK